MKVLMIHGIGQESSTQKELLEKWTESLHKVSPGLLANAETRMAYYGTTLANWANGDTAVGMGTGATDVNIGDADEVAFLTSALREAAEVQNLTDADIASAEQDAAEAVAMDSMTGRFLVGLVRALEKISPLKGSLLLRVVKQGHTYLSSPGAGTAVDNLVRPYLKESPQVVITHSLGTVVAFKLLREIQKSGTDIEIPLLITMGSPLGLEAFKKKLGPPRLKPQSVKRWMNFYDPSDFVSLGKALHKEFATGIEDDGTVDNFTDNAHGIIGYLPHQGVVQALKAVL
ncbi:hypothetical protein SIAM614_15587 [Stappia aggregata IAM 12614]|uniref:Uncharacterized protein n=1 Tax=Roseibium aggregatum (strain ATCC 25650 / DSM 13394 / JCM 20685 / NBRC 16684 / NCIMB 2208 / IAM 12614 / B1) TaxID=384765 RepID=A0NW64_ROSAI|nr:hypothetical protein [Roseibium aggregatum]EAV42780.1 hypothetical protein SIAM614_15587 [Stappia aggregata IAM 12614] [Roseibium aggregatum IAM 12614]